ncbi:MAG: hypothetical protein MUP22_00965 [Desulfobacterales bacterium]|nr:hypothetical protein [Desulfobacterales bacterium]
MIKKIIVGIVVAGISAGLIYGGTYRTIERADNGVSTSQSQKDQLDNRETSDIKGQGRGGRAKAIMISKKNKLVWKLNFQVSRSIS